MARKPTKRRDDISQRPEVRDRLLDIYQSVEKGYADQHERTDRIIDCWDMYNCKLADTQAYNGDSQIFVPIVPSAVDARKTRFVNQIFPQSGRYIDVTAGEDDLPMATMALLETYVRQSRLRTQIMPALIVNGDVEGQYTVYVGWQERSRHVVNRVKKPIEVMGQEMPEFGGVEDFEQETIVDAFPHVEVINDPDLCVLPATADSIEEALGVGGSVTVLRRWTKERVKQAAKDGDIRKDLADDLLSEMEIAMGKQDVVLKQVDAAGVKEKGKFVLIYETWTKLPVDGQQRLCRAYFGGDDKILGCKLNPYWCDECPILSVPVAKAANVFKGRAPMSRVYDLQVLANDIANESADTGHFSAMPIIMTDPEKNPRVGSMVLSLAAIWEVDPNSTSFAEFPDMWMSMMNRLGMIKNEVLQALGVNPAMIPQGTGGDDKRNQAEIANEQQVDILTTADAVTTLEEGILTPMIARFAAYDSQFRDKSVTVRTYGEMGLRANMEEVEPLQLNKRFEFRWLGVEAARNAAQMQQQIAFTNVLKGIPPQMYPGYKLNLTPMLIQGTENTFGPRIAPLIFTKDDPIGVPPDVENQMLAAGFPVMTHPGDNDAEHIQVHLQLMAGGPQADPTGNIQGHISQHQMQMQQKAMAQQQAQMGGPPPQPGLPGSPGGAGPGVAGTPRPGAQPQGPRLMKGPAGMIPPESMPAAGAVTMPRRK